MQPCYVLKADESTQNQAENDLSFVGGLPRIPEGEEMPSCRLCGAQLTFFFQVAFPEDHVWANRTMALFACTSCAHEDHFIPEMLDGPLAGADIPEHFLTSYQKNFRILVFDTDRGVVRSEYEPKVAFKRWKLVSSQAGAQEHKIGGEPNWLLEDEAPATYRQTVPMFFLMQLLEGLTFEKLPEAPPQMTLGLTGEQEPSRDPFYRLFLSNNLYFFGTEDGEPLVYVLTQI